MWPHNTPSYTPPADCFSTMATRIEEISTVGPNSCGGSGTIRAQDLEDAAKSLKLNNVNFVYEVFTESAYTEWATLLIQKYNWASRTRKDTQEFVRLTDLLREAREFWALCRTNSFTHDEGDCYGTICHYIRNSSKCNVGGNATLYESWLKITAARLGCDVTSTKCKMSWNDYLKWSDLLQKQYFVCERTPSLGFCLEKGRDLWLKSKGESSTKNETPPKRNVGGFSMRHTGFSDVKVEDAGEQQLFDHTTMVSRRCDFCMKETALRNRTGQLLRKLSGDTLFFCPFCVRHDFHTKKRRHVLILSLRGMIGYLYHACYQGRVPKLFVTELEDLVRNHVTIGEHNPVFVYDPESFNWCVDFTKIGNTKRKIPVVEVIRTVNEMISAFNPYEYIKEFKSHKYAEKFREAIMDFYSRRYRPEGKPICVPTLVQCASEMREVTTGHNTTKYVKMDVATFRNFTSHELRFSARR